MMKRKWNVIWDKKIILDISNDNVINVYSSLLFLSSLSLSLYLPNHQQQHHKKSAAEQQKMQVSVFFAFDEKNKLVSFVAKLDSDAAYHDHLLPC